MFASSTYTERRKQLAQTMSSGLLLFLGNDESGMNYRDNTYRYRQDSTFLYYFGIAQPGLAAVINADTGEEIIFGHELSLDDVIWMGPQPTLAERAQRVGVSRTEDPARLGQYLNSGATVHYLPPYRPENVIKLNDWLGIPLAQVAALASVAFIKAVVAQRMVKSAEEVAEMQHAVDISRAMHVAAMRSTRPGQKEYEVVSAIYAQALAQGGELAYPIIFSVNGQTLHNHYHGNTMQAGQLALADFGAENPRFYAGDITRTFPVAAKFNAQQREIYDIVLEAETSAIASLRPGVTYRSVHLQACGVILGGLKALGLVQGEVAEMVALGVQGLFMPHGLGHAIGLDVHDMEDLGETYVGYREGLERSTQLGLKSLRLARELEAGFCLTVEPGVYFIPELIDKWKAEGKFTEFINYSKLEAYKSFGGVRIEDNCLITPNGHQVLGTSAIPKTTTEVEAERAAAF